MQVVARSNDWVRLSFIASLLRDAGIASHMLDQHMAATEGSTRAIPRRLAVADTDAAQARQVLREAGMDNDMVAPP